MNDYKLNLVSKGVTAASGLVVSVILARYLGLVLRGEFAFIMQASGVLAIVLGLGFSHAFPYFFRQNPTTDTYHKFVQLFVVQFLLYAAAGAVACVVTRDELVICFVLLLVSAVLYQQMESAMAAYDIGLKIRTNIVGSLVRVLAHLGMLVWFSASVLWPTVISTALWLLMSAFYLFRTVRSPGPRVPVKYANQVIAFSWLPMLSALLMVLNYSVDTLLLKWLGTPEDLGNYAVAAGIVIYMWMIPDAIKEVMVSRLVRSKDPRIVLLPLKAALLASLACVLVVGATGAFLIPGVYGSEFRDSYELCVILSIGVLSMVFFKILGTYILADGRRRFYFLVLVVAVILNVVMNMWAIPAFGAVGAAWSCVTSYSVTGIAFVLYFHRVTGLSWRELLWISPLEAQRMRVTITGGSRD